eukprot:3094751-Pleurochrysis_carterae.AAC.1
MCASVCCARRSLERLVGHPQPDVFEGMLDEHTHRADSKTTFVSSNYGTVTSSRIEVRPDHAKTRAEATEI